MATNETLFTRGKAVMPGGVNSPVRSFRSVGGTPYFVDRAEKWHNLGRDHMEALMHYAKLNTAEGPVTTMAQIMGRYAAEVLPTKAPSTQKGQRRELELLQSLELRGGPHDRHLP